MFIRITSLRLFDLNLTLVIFAYVYHINVLPHSEFFKIPILDNFSYQHTIYRWLNPRKFFTLAQICKKGAKLQPWASSLLGDSAQGLGPFFRVLSQRKNLLTANIFESGPMPTPWKSLDRTPLLPSCKSGQN